MARVSVVPDAPASSHSTRRVPQPTAARCRVASITIRDTAFNNMAPADHGAVLWGVLGRCVVPAEQRLRNAHCGFGSDSDDVHFAALVKIDITFASYSVTSNTSILGPLATNFPALVRSLQVLRIADNRFDESAALHAFATLAAALRELTFFGCGLTSVRGLEGCCEYLRKVNFGCCQLSSIDALGERLYLEEINTSFTAITSIDALRTCPALTRVFFNCCVHLSSIGALAGHQRLREVDVSSATIATVEPLRSCPALERVFLQHCQQLSSIDALEGHLWLNEVFLSGTPIASVEPLLSCPALTQVLLDCEQLPAEVHLPASVKVIRNQQLQCLCWPDEVY